MSVLTDKDPRDVIVAPVISEKSYNNIDEGKYTFIVDPSASKSEIKHAVEKIFGVRIEKVNTYHRPGKRQRTRFGWGSRNDTKRAVITLKEGHAIDIFGGSAA